MRAANESYALKVNIIATSNIKIRAVEYHGKNFIKVRPVLVCLLQRNCLQRDKISVRAEELFQKKIKEKCTDFQKRKFLKLIESLFKKGQQN